MQKVGQGSLSSFSKKYRLISKEDFQSVFAKPYKIKTRSWLILYKFNQLSHARVGIIIGKHLVRQAVKRNKLRRMIRESFRQQHFPGLDIIVMLRSGNVVSTNDLIQAQWAEINELWLRLKNALPAAC